MKILMLTSTLPATPEDSVPGFVREQAEALKRLDQEYDITILAPRTRSSRAARSPSSADFHEERFPYFFPSRFERVADGGIVPNLGKNKLLYLQLPFLVLFQFLHTLRLTLALRPDVLYAHWFTPQGINAALVGKLTRTPFVFTSHSMDVLVLKKLPVFGKALARWGIRQAAAFTAVSERTMQKIASFFAADEWASIQAKGQVIPMGVPTGFFSSAAVRSRETPDREHQHLLFIGRLVRKKGLTYLLEALVRVRKTYPGFTLHVCGDGPEKHTAEERVEQLGLERNVTFHGYVAGETKHVMFDLCEIVIVPSVITASDTEGLPVAVMEAMAKGKVVLASDESGAEALIVHAENGFIFRAKDVSDLARHIEAAMGLGVRAETMRNAARQAARQCDWQTIAERTAAHLFRAHA